MIDIDTEKQIERIRDIMEKIEPNKLTILTGSNGSGKSLIRKQVCFRLARKIPGTDPRHLTVDVSMQGRTETRSELGALCTFMHDDPDDPTSAYTYYLVKTLIRSFVEEKGHSKRYLIIDEPEIGMSEEAQLGFVEWLRTKLDVIMAETYGLMIITHSRSIVEALKGISVFINMDGIETADEWLNRKIVPMDLEELKKNARELYLAIQNYSGEKKG